MDGCHRRRGIGYGIITVDIMNILTIDPTTTDLQVVSSYVEDDRELNVLVSTMVSPDEKPGVPEPRWTVIADPVTREIIRIEFCVATDEGFEYPEYTPTDEQMLLFKKFVDECQQSVGSLESQRKG